MTKSIQCNQTNGIRHRYSEKLIQKTIDVWQPRSEKKLTQDDAIVMLDNAVGVFRLLIRWDREERQGDTESCRVQSD